MLQTRCRNGNPILVKSLFFLPRFNAQQSCARKGAVGNMGGGVRFFYSRRGRRQLVRPIELKFFTAILNHSSNLFLSPKFSRHLKVEMWTFKISHFYLLCAFRTFKV